MSSAWSEAAHILAVDGSPIDLMLITRILHGSHYKGEELLKHLKGSSELRDIPVAIMSSDKCPTRITSCQEEGAMAYLLKPLQMSGVSSLCRRILE